MNALLLHEVNLLPPRLWKAWAQVRAPEENGRVSDSVPERGIAAQHERWLVGRQNLARQ